MVFYLRYCFQNVVCRRILCAFSVALLVVLWFSLRLWQAWDAWLPPEQDGIEQQSVVQLLDFPAPRDDAWQADVYVKGLPGKVRLGFPSGLAPKLDCLYTVSLKLKRPRGFHNPGLFDYQLWLLQSGYVATGYVRVVHDCQQIKPGWLLQWRENIAARISSVEMTDRARSTLLALTIGSYADIDLSQWQLLRDSGTIHILSVSGLHIVLVAALGYWLFALVTRALIFPLRLWPANHWGSVASFFFAVFYALLADFSVPTQRSLLMVAVAVSQRLFYSHFRWMTSWWVALLLVFCLNPLSVLACGFWFSFLATWVLVAVYHGVVSGVPVWRRYLVTQGMLFLSMLPLSLFLYGYVPWLSLPANVLAVPLITFVSMPLAFLSLLAMPLPVLSQPLLEWSSWSLDGYWWLMQEMVRLAPFVQIYWGGVSQLSVWLGVFGVLLLLLPRGMPGRWLAAVLCLPVAFPVVPQLQKGEMSLTVLDVGQGLASVVRTSGHTLVYDTGNRFTSRFDSGRDIVSVHLRQQRLPYIDFLLVSHSDADHAGGVPGLLSSMPVRQRWSGTPDRLKSEDFSPCRAGMHWRWDGVDFTILSPASGALLRETNNRSCILRVSNGRHVFLLPGDAEAKVESSLPALYGWQLNADVMVAPHHGSKTSSSTAFLQAVDPSTVLVSAGYKNRFNHPHPRVVKAYERRGITWLSTAESGALTAYSNTEGLQVQSAVCEYPLPWRRALRGCGSDGL
jgi:competence protein ComEC